MPQRSPALSQPPRRRWKWAAIIVAAALPLLVLALWVAVHRVSWMGPFVANSLRAIVGTQNVARLEDFVYGIEDRYNRLLRKGERPEARWTVPVVRGPLPPPLGPQPEREARVKRLSPFRPKPVGPVHASWSAPGDGEWVAIVDPRFASADPYMYKTLLHPDRGRSWAELFVVAVDLRRVSLHAVPGYRQPRPNVKPEPKLNRPGLIPADQQDRLLAAFNGGFMTEHGQYGMMVDGVTLVAPRDRACTIAKYQDGSLRIAQWLNIKDTLPQMVWYRQTPSCMYENNKLHSVLRWTDSPAWGATVDGDTVIRRSAIGLNAARDILYVSISNHTTAQVIAAGMHHAGATDIAQLDVNWSYPKFVTFRSPEPGAPLEAVALASGFEYSTSEYIRDAERRDFFYLTVAEPNTTAGNFQKARPPSSVSGEVSRGGPRWAGELRSSESGDPERSVRGVREQPKRSETQPEAEIGGRPHGKDSGSSRN
jgi:hypothetical protein